MVGTRFLVPLLFFLIVPFTASPTRLQQALEVANVLIVCVLGVWVLSGRAARIVRSPLNAPTALYLGLVALSYFRNPRPLSDSTNIEHIWAVLSLMVFLVVANNVTSEREIFHIRRWTFAIFNAALVMALVVFWTGWTMPMIGDAQIAFQNRARAGVTGLAGGGVHGVGIHALGLLLFAWSQPSFFRSQRVRYALCAVYIGCVALSGSRVVLVTLVGVALAAMAIQRRWLALFGAALVFAVVGGAAYAQYDVLPAVIQRMFAFSADAYSIQNRLMMWAASMELFSQSPLFGIGYGAIDPARFPRELFSVFLDTKDPVEMFARSPHNSYVFVLRSLGLVGGILFAWMAVTSLATAARVRRAAAEPWLREWAMFLLLNVIGAFVALGSGGAENRPRLYWWIGMIAALDVLHRMTPTGALRDVETVDVRQTSTGPLT